MLASSDKSGRRLGDASAVEPESPTQAIADVRGAVVTFGTISALARSALAATASPATTEAARISVVIAWWFDAGAFRPPRRATPSAREGLCCALALARRPEPRRDGDRHHTDRPDHRGAGAGGRGDESQVGMAGG
jgi:hypothetical protein